jgi:hypothetical protein
MYRKEFIARKWFKKIKISMIEDVRGKVSIIYKKKLLQEIEDSR